MKRTLYLLAFAMLVASCAPKDARKAFWEDRVAQLEDGTHGNAAEKTVSSDRLVVPGKSVGQTKIDEDIQDVTKALGRPDAGDAAMGKSINTWYAKHDTNGYQTSIFCSRNMGNDETSRVKQIRITSPWFKTSDGLHVGSSRADIAARYRLRQTASYKEKGKKYTTYDTPAGIAFEVHEAGICTGIIVHDVKMEGGVSYLSFHAQ